MSDQFTDEQRRWVEDYCNGSITPDEFARFESALEASAGFRTLTRRYLTMDSHLYRGAELAILREDAWMAPPPVKPAFTLPWIPWAAAAGLVFLLGIGLGGWLNPRSGPDASATEHRDDGIAVLNQVADAEWEDDSPGGLAAGSILSPGRLQLKAGLAQIEFYNGARLILEGPVDIELQSVNEVICHHGRLRAQVPPAARGFTVLSPQFELVDLGTEFGVEVGDTGEAKVHVFDGEVELYPADGRRSPQQLRRLLGGSGLAWASNGEIASSEPAAHDYPSFEEVRDRGRQVSRQRYENWKAWNESVQGDPRVVAHYDFEDDETRLTDHGASGSHGTVIGGEWTRGRWPEKGALEFKRPGDRVRVDVPGEFEALTIAAWIRMDALPQRMQALLLTDEYRINHVHWQIGREAELRFGMRLHRKRGEGKVSSGYSSPTLFNPRRIGVWSLVTTSYDPAEGMVRHYLNGTQVSDHEIVTLRPLKIGTGDIGNWSVPLENAGRPQPLRNFVGRMDTLTIWNAALGADEIQEMHRKTRP